MRRALVIEVQNYLRSEPRVESTQLIADDLLAGRRTYKGTPSELFDPRIRNGLEKFRYAGVGYQFDLTMTENDNATGNASIEFPLAQGTFTLGIKGGAEKLRQNERIVKIGDSFGDLVTEEEEFCNLHFPEEIEQEDGLYPITGSIGLHETTATFIKLVNRSSDPLGEYSDELTFKTKLLTQIKPAIKLTKVVPHDWRLASADMDLNADRTDTHKLKLVFTDRRAKKPEMTKHLIDLGSGVGLLVPLPAKATSAPAKPRKGPVPYKDAGAPRPRVQTKSAGGANSAFGVSQKESSAIKRDALDALDRSNTQQYLKTLPKLEGLIDR